MDTSGDSDSTPRADQTSDSRPPSAAREAAHSAPDEREPRTTPPSPDQLNRAVVDSLFNEITRIVQGNPEFYAFDHRRIWDSAELPVRYGITGLEIFRTAGDQARICLFADLRKAEKLPFREIALTLKINRHIPPHDQKTSGGISDSQSWTFRKLYRNSGLTYLRYHRRSAPNRRWPNGSISNAL